MAKITKEAALLYHSQGKPGKIEVVPTKPYSTQTDLSLAYSPGVAEPCLEIEKNPQDAYKYTAKGNLVAVISNGTAVLGLGDIGAMAGKPVMEGKGLLFKIYGGIDVFDIEVNEKDPEKFIEAVKAIAPTFGGINLEDIKAPECFEIERRLKEELDIPVMHDDQHGTAIISAAGLLNALEVAGKKIEDVKIVVNGAGAAAISCTKLYEALGATHENIIMLDSKGVITSDRENLDATKRYFATDRRDIHTLEEAIQGAEAELMKDAEGLSYVKVTFDSGILFSSGNASLTAAAKNSLGSFKANVLTSDMDLAIVGYTDNDPWKGCTAAQSKQKNLVLSEQRAQSVSSYLRTGARSSLIKYVVGKGEENPVASNATAAGKAENRRVEVYILPSRQMIESANAGTLK